MNEFTNAIENKELGKLWSLLIIACDNPIIKAKIGRVDCGDLYDIAKEIINYPDRFKYLIKAI